MTYRKTGKWATLTMTCIGTQGAQALATGDTWQSCRMPFDGYIESVQMCVTMTGGSSGATEVMIANGANNLWAANTLQIAYSASDGSSAVIGRSDMNSNGTALFSEGDQFDLDVDEVPGTASTAPLTVTIHVVGN
jgi:hypothetical protein